MAVFNEDQIIAKQILSDLQFSDQVIVCDDLSLDYTFQIAQKTGALTIRNKTHSGYGGSIYNILKEIDNRNIQFDSILIHQTYFDSNEIPILSSPINEGKADLVIRKRSLAPDNIPSKLQIHTKLIKWLRTNSLRLLIYAGDARAPQMDKTSTLRQGISPHAQMF